MHLHAQPVHSWRVTPMVSLIPLRDSQCHSYGVRENSGGRRPRPSGPPRRGPTGSPRPSPPGFRSDPLTPTGAEGGLEDLERWLLRLHDIPTARAAALEQLIRIEQEGAFAGLVGGSPSIKNASNLSTGKAAGSVAAFKGGEDAEPALTRAAMSPRDRRLVTELVSGVTRWRRRLDYVLTHLPRPTRIDTMDPPLRALLRMGAYELLELKAPAHTVNEHVELAKKTVHVGCGAVANATLRALARERDEGRTPTPPPPAPGASTAEMAAAAAVAFSHPDWIVERWAEAFGPAATVKLLKYNNAWVIPQFLSFFNFSLV
jgi:transcription termination factor NusB